MSFHAGRVIVICHGIFMRMYMKKIHEYLISDPVISNFMSLTSCQWSDSVTLSLFMILARKGRSFDQLISPATKENEKNW